MSGGCREHWVPGWEPVGICQREGQCPPTGQGCATCGDDCREAGREKGAILAARVQAPMARKVHMSLLQVRAGSVRRVKEAGCDQPLSKESAEEICWSLERSGAS